MPKVRKLTKSVADKFGPASARYYVWDEGLPGFGLVVQPTGKKTYCYQYRNSHGRSRRYTLGEHGGKLTTDQIRKNAEALRPQIRDGYDPLAGKKAAREALTVAELLGLYLESAKFSEKTEATRNTDKGRITRHLRPLLGKKIADNLTPEEIKKALIDIERGKTAGTFKTGPRGLARVTGGPGAARMAIRLLKSAYSWSHEEGLIKNNNAARVRVGKDENRNLVLSEDDYKSLFNTLDQLEETLQIRPCVAAAIRVIALTGARRGEIAGLKWKQVNLRKGIIEIPRAEHKTGKKTEEPRIIGLPSAAQQIIANQPSDKSAVYVFPPASGAGPINLSKPWRKIRAKAGLDPAIGLHGLRHSLATQMAVSGAQAGQIMAVMGHRDLATSQKYIHIAQQETKKMAEDAAAGITAALVGKKPGKVVKLKGKKNA